LRQQPRGLAGGIDIVRRRDTMGGGEFSLIAGIVAAGRGLVVGSRISMGGGELLGISGNVVVGRALVVPCDSLGRGGFSKIARSAAGRMSLGRCDFLGGGE